MRRCWMFRLPLAQMGMALQNMTSGVIADGIDAQAHQVFRNLTAVLQAAGSDMSKAVKTTVFIKNMDDFATVNAIYAEYFSEPFPARSCVEVARLPKDVLVECEVIAEA